MINEIDTRRLAMRFAATGLIFAQLLWMVGPANAGADEDEARLEKGKEIAMSRSRGNCLACHMMDDGDLPGTIGPPLVAMQLRYPDKKRLREQIWDATKANPDSRMPPFGRHRLLTEEEIDQVTDYVYSL